ncbi:hypothetical protein [Janibacter sp. Soil728]|uniref:hypothetical protein n=1 Tax=Janibacter sp. Soil728 TaxID=1736393 RepID=UPI000B112309|nr:hypothetical protein [Janibacter sp. Soil728]
MRTVYRVVLSLLAASLGTLALGVAPAAAAPDPFGCETAPVAESPADGLGGWLLPAPKTAPQQVDPTSGASLLQNHGVAGLSWFSFDDDCDFGTGDVTDKPAEVTDGIASTVFLPAVLSAGATVSAGNAFGNPDWLDFLDPVLQHTSTAMAKSFTEPLMPMFILVAALSALVFAARRQVSQTLRVLAFVLIGLCVVGLTVGWPIKASKAADDTVSAVVLTGQKNIISGKDEPPTQADREQPGAVFVGPLYKALVWDVWLRGQLGSDDSAVAQKYGYELYASRTLTYAEKDQVNRDPSGAGKKIYEQKKKDFKKVASKIKDEDPSAYNTLTNSNFGQRMGLAIGGSLVAPTAFSLPFLAFVLLLLCFLYWRFTVILGPMLGAVMAMMPSVARSVARKLAAVALNTVIFGLGAAVYIALARFITEANDIPFGWQCLAVGVLTLVGWIVLHPVRALTRFTSLNMPGADASAAHGVVTVAKTVLTIAAGTALGGAGDDEDEEGKEGENEGKDKERSKDGDGKPTHQWKEGDSAETERDDEEESSEKDSADEPGVAVQPADSPTSAPITQDVPTQLEVEEDARAERPPSPVVVTVDDVQVDVPKGEDPSPIVEEGPNRVPAAPVVVIEDSSSDPIEQVVSAQAAPSDPIPARYDDGAVTEGGHANPEEAGWVFYDASTKTFVSSNGLEEVDRGGAS